MGEGPLRTRNPFHNTRNRDTIQDIAATNGCIVVSLSKDDTDDNCRNRQYADENDAIHALDFYGDVLGITLRVDTILDSE